MKNQIFIPLCLLFVCLFQLQETKAASKIIAPCGSYGEIAEPKIQVAILLDTSGSMQGLIDQARQQVWTMVSELATTKYNGIAPTFELSLYEYGKETLEEGSHWIRQILPLTTDLDAISEELFALRTDGGNEYCGAVIKQSLIDLRWSTNHNDLKIIFIAGNEAFTQGPVDYKISCKSAIERGIIVNTIFCGNEKEGVRSGWKDGADLSDGKFLTINHNATVVHFDAPQDKKINELNEQLNKTYIAYGAAGKDKVARQSREDDNALKHGRANSSKRAVAKASSNYKNEDWDLVDALDENSEILEVVEDSELIEEMVGLSTEEKKAYVLEKKVEREKIQQEIQDLNSERKAYIANERANQPAVKTLDDVIIETIREQATRKNYCFDE